MFSVRNVSICLTFPYQIISLEFEFSRFLTLFIKSKRPSLNQVGLFLFSKHSFCENCRFKEKLKVKGLKLAMISAAW